MDENLRLSQKNIEIEREIQKMNGWKTKFWWIFLLGIVIGVIGWWALIG